MLQLVGCTLEITCEFNIKVERWPYVVSLIETLHYECMFFVVLF
jgi:hypothetical protein